MRLGFYPKLAFDGILKNRRLYIPYILTAICLVAMEYIISFLSLSPNVTSIHGGEMLSMFLVLGNVVVGLFSLMFMFYSNSFMMKRRKKEFGLFNILGMGKRHIGIVVFFENTIVYLVALVTGLITGIALSKFAELGLLRLTKSEVNLSFSIPLKAIVLVSVIFLVIFFLLLLNSLRQIRFSSAMELMKSENTGEKPPKANWVIGVLGFVILAVAYYLAISVTNTVSAINFFFTAVLLVIVATYLIMVFGSIVICRVLKNNKNYYYKLNHYVSVSSMMYRMKRNGAGLASICILSTMVLVMISSTACLYFGENDLLDQRDPRQVVMTAKCKDASLTNEDYVNYLNGIVNSVDDKPVNSVCYSAINTYGPLYDDTIYLDIDSLSNPILDFNKVIEWYIFDISEYNRLTGENVTLGSNEVMAYTAGNTIPDTLEIYELDLKLNITKRLDSNPVVTGLMTAINKQIYLFADSDVIEKFASCVDIRGLKLSPMFFTYFFDITKGNDYEQTVVDAITNHPELNNYFDNIIIESKETTKIDFFTSFGGLFYLGIVLSIVFTLASVLIIYYKQISEGYEDQSRFDIMKKVGMTDKEIKKGINSQLLTVFFLPLVGAGLHMAFAFPMIMQLLQLFNLTNRTYFATTILISFVVFAIFYTIVYKITSNSYYKIVSAKLNA